MLVFSKVFPSKHELIDESKLIFLNISKDLTADKMINTTKQTKKKNNEYACTRMYV